MPKGRDHGAERPYPQGLLALPSGMSVALRRRRPPGSPASGSGITRPLSPGDRVFSSPAAVAAHRRSHQREGRRRAPVAAGFEGTPSPRRAAFRDISVRPRSDAHPTRLRSGRASHSAPRTASLSRPRRHRPSGGSALTDQIVETARAQRQNGLVGSHSTVWLRTLGTYRCAAVLIAKALHTGWSVCVTFGRPTSKAWLAVLLTRCTSQACVIAGFPVASGHPTGDPARVRLSIDVSRPPGQSAVAGADRPMGRRSGAPHSGREHT